MGDLYQFDDVDGFSVGTVGVPGQRTFFVQLRADGRRVTLKCEKQQVGVLGQYLQKLLEDLPSPSDRPLDRSLELVLPAEPVAFAIGQMGLAYDQELDRFVVMLEEFVAPDPDTGEPDPELAADAGRVRFRITRGQALAFAERTEDIVSAGSPIVRMVRSADGSCRSRVPTDELMTGDASELTQPAPEGTDAVEVLTRGEIAVLGRMPWSSNATYLATVRHDGIEARAIYKPRRGERPLWDFPSGLYKREVAVYELSEVMGLHLVPPTVLRDGPFGDGSVQWFIEADFRQHYFSMHETRPELYDQFRSMAVFDFVANNTDRKSGHCLIDVNHRIWGIDNGLCFAADFKLRTVIWEFGGEPLTEGHKTALTALVDNVPLRVAALLDDDEITALRERAEELLSDGVLPIDHTGRRYPWPLV